MYALQMHAKDALALIDAYRAGARSVRQERGISLLLSIDEAEAVTEALMAVFVLPNDAYTDEEVQWCDRVETRLHEATEKYKKSQDLPVDKPKK